MTVVVMGVAVLGQRLRRRAISAAAGLRAARVAAARPRAALAHGVRSLVGVLVAAGLAVGAVDLLRPSDQRTHVGKFFEKAGTDFDGATLVLRRKAAENLSVLGHSVLLGCIIVAALLVAYLWCVTPRSLPRVVVDVGPHRAGRPRSPSSSSRCSDSR